MRSLPWTGLVLATLAAGCGGSATARLQLHDATGASASRPGALVSARPGPDLLAVRLLAVYLSEDVDAATQDNTGRTSMIWLNPECREDIEGCNVQGEPGAGPRVKSAFDFAGGPAAVDAALNAQDRPVQPGRYRYARVEFCKSGPGGKLAEPNLWWSVPGLAAPRSLALSLCGVTSLPFAAPMELKAGDAVTVTLAYDLAQAVRSAAVADWQGPCLGLHTSAQFCGLDCAEVDGVRSCMTVPQFTPSASQQAAAAAP